MFYSHQLLARKAPLGQIWMAATLHAKINRRKLDKLNIIQICEQILNPSVPMALRLSGILMGGVVIVYERKVKLLYDDVTRLLVEINEAWKVKTPSDPTILPKRKTQAKKEAISLPDKEENNVEDLDHPFFCSATGMTVGFQQTAYFAMRLDSVDETYVNENGREEETTQYHQAEAENITLFERFDVYQDNNDHYNRFERFDIEDDEEAQMNFTQRECSHIPASLVPSPPPQDEVQIANKIEHQHPEGHTNHQSDGGKEPNQHDYKRTEAIKRKPRRMAYIMDYEHTILPGQIYQSWLQDASDIVSRRGRKRKHTSFSSTSRVATLMDIPPTVLSNDLFTNGHSVVHYPPPLHELWIKSMQPPHDSPSERTSHPFPPEPSSSSPPGRLRDQSPVGLGIEDYNSGVGSQSFGASIEKQRTNLPAEMNEPMTNFLSSVFGMPETNVTVIPGNSGDGLRSIPSSGSGNGIHFHNSEANSGRPSKKRHHSWSRNSSGGLEPVAEDTTWQLPEPDFKLARLPEHGLTPDQEFLVETGPTQTQKPAANHPLDKMTDSIKMHMKAHFDTPGAPQMESLDHLASGMNRKAAAQLFYQTCVLASHDFLKVDQRVPYGDILISRGAKM